ncbi:MAG: LysE family translocator, partial [Tabrizicola sp.]
FEAFPWLYTVLKVVSVVYMLWLAWKIAQAAAPEGGQGGGRPFSFLQAAGFQWVNPKAWAMALGAVSAYVVEPSVWVYAAVAGAFACVNLPSVSVWAGAGQAVRRWLDGPGRLRVFNWAMAGLLVLSLWPVVTLEM